MRIVCIIPARGTGKRKKITIFRGVMKVIIIGKASGWENAPMEGETWGVNSLLLRRPVKLSFQMHDIDRLLSEPLDSIKAEIAEINRLGIPVITQKKHKLLPTAIPFPLDEMPVKYFTNSIAYMIAYAIYKKAKEIEMYGVAMFLREEYSLQRPCIEFWIGCAMAKGIKITVHEPTTIECFKDVPLYGYNVVI